MLFHVKKHLILTVINLASGFPDAAAMLFFQNSEKKCQERVFSYHSNNLMPGFYPSSVVLL